ncbi:hypothetical protein C5167_018023 [Papaver somniferum]|uniref:Pre-mRNA cleavage factor Im 25 kDa subunit n=1 Tax=Papaver somniferum TaxID=3469 RepID=A0A4Y7ILK4_PAPSO|nr:hypothetical protein C5167_018023 [Papaver somniferum]
MDDQIVDEDDTNSCVVNIYPLRGNYFGSKDAILPKHHIYFDQLQKLKSIYSTNGMRVCVEAVMLVELFKQPHLLVLQMRNSFFKLPGGRLRLGESEIEGLKRKLSNKLSVNGNGVDDNWEECLKLFLVRFPMNKSFVVPKNQKLLVLPLFQVHDNFKTYGQIVSEVPSFLSRFSFNMNNV